MALQGKSWVSSQDKKKSSPDFANEATVVTSTRQFTFPIDAEAASPRSNLTRTILTLEARASDLIELPRSS